MLIFAIEQCTAGDQLNENAAHGPDIDSLVVDSIDKKFGGSVPSCANVLAHLLAFWRQIASRAHIDKFQGPVLRQH